MTATEFHKRMLEIIGQRRGDISVDDITTDDVSKAFHAIGGMCDLGIADEYDVITDLCAVIVRLEKKIVRLESDGQD